MIFVLDNYDSFTYNLVHMLAETGLEVRVARNREIDPEAVMKLAPQAIVLSPGPGRPEEAGCMMDLIRRAAGRIPMLGVCLGHQAIGAVYGASVVHAKRIMHGKLSPIRHDGKGLFAGLPQDLKVVRYHSLALAEPTIPAALEITARADDGEIMGVRARKGVLEGIQYHPESMLTERGREQIGNFLKEAGVVK